VHGAGNFAFASSEPTGLQEIDLASYSAHHTSFCHHVHQRTPWTSSNCSPFASRQACASTLQAMLWHAPLKAKRRQLLAETVDARGFTALHAAVDTDQTAIAKLLVDNVGF